MAELTKEQLKELMKKKKFFLTDLIRDLRSIITLMGSKEEIEREYFIRIAASTRGLLTVAELENDQETIRITSGFLKLIGSKNVEKKLKYILVYDKLFDKLAKKVEPYKSV